MSIGVGVFKDNAGKLEFITATPLGNQRENRQEIELDPGSYYLVPRTSGVGFQKPLDAPREGKIPVFKNNGELSELYATTLREIFRRLERVNLDLNLGYLSHAEFNTFLLKAVNESISEY